MRTTSQKKMAQIGLTLSAILLAPSQGFSQDQLSLLEAKKIAVERHKGLSIGRERANVVGEHIESLSYSKVPDVGFVFGGSSHIDQSEQKSGTIGYAYLKYKILDGGDRRRKEALLESKKRFQEVEVQLTERDVLSEVEKSFYVLAIYKQSLGELQELKKRTATLTGTARRMAQVGSANDLVISGLTIASERMALLEDSIREEITDEESKLGKFIGSENVARLNRALPKTDDLSQRQPKVKVLAEIAAVERLAGEADAALQGTTSSWIPMLSLEGRYGAVPLSERYFDRQAQGEILLTADWSLTSGLQKRKEREAFVREKTLLEAEADFLRTNSTYDLDRLNQKIGHHEAKIQNLSKHYTNVSNYSRRVEKESAIGSVAVFEAKSTIDELVSLTETIMEEKIALWLVVTEFNRLTE
jgi:hypothetical protein